MGFYRSLHPLTKSFKASSAGLLLKTLGLRVTVWYNTTITLHNFLLTPRPLGAETWPLPEHRRRIAKSSRERLSEPLMEWILLTGSFRHGECFVLADGGGKIDFGFPSYHADTTRDGFRSRELRAVGFASFWGCRRHYWRGGQISRHSIEPWE